MPCHTCRGSGLSRGITLSLSACLLLRCFTSILPPHKTGGGAINLDLLWSDWPSVSSPSSVDELNCFKSTETPLAAPCPVVGGQCVNLVTATGAVETERVKLTLRTDGHTLGAHCLILLNTLAHISAVQLASWLHSDANSCCC